MAMTNNTNPQTGAKTMTTTPAWKRIKTIRRNSKRIKALAENAQKITLYTLENGFVGQEIPAEKVAAVAGRISTADDYRFSAVDGVVTARCHSNRWFEIVDAQ